MPGARTALLVLMALLALCVPDARAQSGQAGRIALVIGNAAYRDAPLKNPVNDARAVAASLRALNFDVIEVENATRERMARAILDFSGRASPGASAVFFYAGHGMQVRGRNYLIPVDASIASEGAAQFASVDVASVLAEMEQAGTAVNIVILDACRNNPFERRMRGRSRGLAAIDAARGALIAYATAPGSVAADGEGANGVYTAALLRSLAVPGLKAEEVFKRVRLDVTAETQNQQTPWESSSLTGDFVFNAAAPPPAALAPAAQQAPVVASDREALFWDSIKDSRRPEDFADYLARYPNGEFAGLARRRVEDLHRTTTAAAPPAYGAPAAQPAPRPTVAAAPAPGATGQGATGSGAPGTGTPGTGAPGLGGVRGASAFDGTWEGRFLRADSHLGSGVRCYSSRVELVIVDGKIVDGFIRLDDGRQFNFKNPKVGRVAFEGAIAADGGMNVKMRMYDNFSTNFMNIRYAGAVHQDAVEGDWRDDFGHCRGTFKLARRR